MPRNRRNTRRIKSIRDVLNMKTFLIIVGILLVIIVSCIGINEYRRYQDRKLLAKQREELEKQSQELFSQMSTSISETNLSISESDSIIKMSAVGDILCSEAMLQDAYNETSKTYDFSYMFNNVSGFIDNADIIMGTMETGIIKGAYNDKNAPLEFARAVKNSGVNLVTISHNHSLDNGVSGLQETKENLESIGFDVVGDKLENANAVYIKEVKNTKIAFLTYTCFLDNQNQIKEEELECINMYSEEQYRICKGKWCRIHMRYDTLGRCNIKHSLRRTKKHSRLFSRKWSKPNNRSTSISSTTNGSKAKRRWRQRIYSIFNRNLRINIISRRS